jgi:peptide/nickel transport system permease protein
MIAVILSRIGQAVLVMLAVTAVAFLMFRFVGDPVSIMAREDATVAEKEQMRQALGLDRPIVVQYGRFLGRIVSGDFGISYRNQRPVVELIAERLPRPPRPSNCRPPPRSLSFRRQIHFALPPPPTAPHNPLC